MGIRDRKLLGGLVALCVLRLILVIVWVLALPGLATPATPAPARDEGFTRYRELDANVEFWREVFTGYTSRQIVLHDPYHLDLVYVIADLGDIVDSKMSPMARDRAIARYSEEETDRVAAIVRRLAKHPPRNFEERRIASRLKRKGSALPDHEELAARIRVQRGLGDQFCDTMARASRYLPAMEEVFAAQGLPIGLVSLPLVESAYRHGAYSRVGAAGMWQFTRSTGRRFVRVDHVVDERLDPMRSTEAAAKFLAENYRRLGTWPLAITAYNYGGSGMASAVRKYRTNNLATIIRRHRSRYFGFASRNFYAEFLAAFDAMKNVKKYCGRLPPPPPLARSVVVPDYVGLDVLAASMDLDKDDLAALNPALQPDVARGRLYVPAGHRLNVPAAKARGFADAYAGLPPAVRYKRQLDYYASHRVRRGQTLSHIALLYRSSVAALKYHNNISDPRRMRTGQVLKIPVGAGRSAYRSHLVREGQTLSHIASLYRTSVSVLQSRNGIADPDRVKSGQVIRVPTAVVARTHRVGRGQTLSHIADIYRTTVAALKRVNGIADPRALRYGQVIRLP